MYEGEQKLDSNRMAWLVAKETVTGRKVYKVRLKPCDVQFTSKKRADALMTALEAIVVAANVWTVCDIGDQRWKDMGGD